MKYGRQGQSLVMQASSHVSGIAQTRVCALLKKLNTLQRCHVWPAGQLLLYETTRSTNRYCIASAYRQAFRTFNDARFIRETTCKNNKNLPRRWDVLRYEWYLLRLFVR